MDVITVPQQFLDVYPQLFRGEAHIQLAHYQHAVRTSQAELDTRKRYGYSETSPDTLFWKDRLARFTERLRGYEAQLATPLDDLTSKASYEWEAINANPQVEVVEFPRMPLWLRIRTVPLVHSFHQQRVYYNADGLRQVEDKHYVHNIGPITITFMHPNQWTRNNGGIVRLSQIHRGKENIHNAPNIAVRKMCLGDQLDTMLNLIHAGELSSAVAWAILFAESDSAPAGLNPVTGW